MAYTKGVMIGEKNPRWKGGVKIAEGYRFIAIPHHPFKNKQGYIAEHRLVMESIIGRWLKPNEIVHHLDHNKQNNKPENLVLTTRAEHKKLHHPEIGINTRFKKGNTPSMKTGRFKNCITCNSPHWVSPSDEKLGYDKYCSKKCHYEMMKIKHSIKV